MGKSRKWTTTPLELAGLAANLVSQTNPPDGKDPKAAVELAVKYLDAASEALVTEVAATV